MGGGAEIPQRGKEERELLLFTPPHSEEEIDDLITEIKEEFPNLDVEFSQVAYDGKTEVPKGIQPHRLSFEVSLRCDLAIHGFGILLTHL